MNEWNNFGRADVALKDNGRSMVSHQRPGQSGIQQQGPKQSRVDGMDNRPADSQELWRMRLGITRDERISEWDDTAGARRWRSFGRPQATMAKRWSSAGVSEWSEMTVLDGRDRGRQVTQQMRLMDDKSGRV